MESSSVQKLFRMPDLLSFMLLYHEISQSLQQKQVLFCNYLGSLKRMDSKMKEIEEELKQVPVQKHPINYTLPVKRDLFSLLESKTETYEFGLKLASPLPPTLSKGKMFNLNTIVRNYSHSLDNSVSFPLLVELYSSENPPQPIQQNVRGKPIIESVSSLALLKYVERKKCHISYAKVRINEVTSHYPNGWVFLVVKPDPLCATCSQLAIKPLVIEKLMVKAKRSLKEDSD